MSLQKIAAEIMEKKQYPNGLKEVSRKYTSLLEPIANYVITKYMRSNPPKIASGVSFEKPISYIDTPVDVGKTAATINGLTAIYDDKIITVSRDYSGLIVACFSKTRDESKNWINNFEHMMRTQNQYRGHVLYAADNAIQFHDLPEVSWDDVVLNDKIKNDIRLNTVTFLGDEKMASVGVMKRGLVMYGPPGTGKTSVVKSIFRELNSGKVSRVYVTAESFKFMAMSDLFNLLHYLGPTVLAFEDVDMVGVSRDVKIGSSLLGDLLTNLDGMRNHRDPLVVIASTNKISMLDEALANRPCRFDRKIEIGLPDDVLLKRLYSKFVGSDVEDEIVKMSKSFTGSHVVETVNTARILAANTDKSIIECLKEACQIIRDNFFPGQYPLEIKEARRNALIKKGYLKRKNFL